MFRLFKKKEVPRPAALPIARAVFTTTREAAPLCRGTKARLRAPVIQGEIMDTEYDKENLCLRHLLAYTDQSGEAHHRWFPETELEEIKENDNA